MPPEQMVVLLAALSKDERRLEAIALAERQVREDTVDAFVVVVTSIHERESKTVARKGRETNQGEKTPRM